MGASESKLAFKQSIFQLATDEEYHPKDAFWSHFYTLPESADDVFSLWSPNDLHTLTHTHTRDAQVEPRKNLETLVYTLVARLVKLQTDGDGRDGQDNGQDNGQEDEGGSTEKRNGEIVNCMRILTRLFPFIYEAQHLREWAARFFWQPRRPTYFWDHKHDRPGRLFDGLDPSKEYGIDQLETTIGPPLGEALVSCIVSYCFFPGFTIPARVGEDGRAERAVSVRVWQTGIGSSKSLGCSRENEKYQQETVRLLVTISSLAMYMTPNDIATSNIQPLTFITTQIEKRMINGLLCSLLNTVLKYNPNLWSALSNVNGALDLATGANEAKKVLVTNCLHLILVLVIYDPPTETRNQFRQSFSSLHRPDDLQFIQTGLSTVLAQPVSTTGNFTYTIGKDKALPWAPEMISLLWELLQSNKRFRRYLVETGCALDYVVLVLYYALDAKDDAAKHGVLRMCVFVLQTLSAETTFATKLNQPFKHMETLPVLMRVPHFHGSYADFVICSIHTISKTVQRRPELESVYPALVAIIKNVAPLQKNLARATSSKMMSLFEMLSSPGFLLANDSNNTLLINFLEACNEILTNHPEENNPRFIEVLVANRTRFKALRALTVEGATAEMERLAQERKDRSTSSDSRSSVSRGTSFDSNLSPTSRRSPSLGTLPEDQRFALGDDDDDEEEEEEEDIGNTARPTSLSEKARGKQPESTTTNTNTTTTASRGTSSVSRNFSANGLQNLVIPKRDGVTSGFQPSQAWLESWYSRLPLEVIFQTIADFERRKLQQGRGGVDRAAEFSRSSGDGGRDVAKEEEAGTGPPKSSPQNFHWTPVSLGWYTALLWSRIYLHEAETFQGSGGLYSSTNVVLFRRSAGGGGQEGFSLRSPKGAIDAVGVSIAQRISSFSLKSGGGGGGGGGGGEGDTGASGGGGGAAKGT